MHDEGNIWVALIFFLLCFCIAVALMMVHLFGIPAGIGSLIAMSGYGAWYCFERVKDKR